LIAGIDLSFAKKFNGKIIVCFLSFIILFAQNSFSKAQASEIVKEL